MLSPVHPRLSKWFCTYCMDRLVLTSDMQWGYKNTIFINGSPIIGEKKPWHHELGPWYHKLKEIQACDHPNSLSCKGLSLRLPKYNLKRKDLRSSVTWTCSKSWETFNFKAVYVFSVFLLNLWKLINLIILS